MENSKAEGNGGVGIAWLGFLISGPGARLSGQYWLIPLIIGLMMSTFGCVLWAQRKNRHWAFGLWGLLAPVGFLGVALLKEKQIKLKD